MIGIVSVENFCLSFPELAECDRYQIERALLQASKECPTHIYGNLHQEAIAILRLLAYKQPLVGKYLDDSGLR